LPAEQEADGISALEFANVPTVPLIAWGRTDDGRSFLITKDLAGFEDAEKAVRAGMPFERILDATADLAARLHDANLHHRDLYLCHFFVRTTPSIELRLIDPARVAYLPPWPFRNRWIVKDLAQFWHSASQIDVPEDQRVKWLRRYADQRKLTNVDGLRRAVERKAGAIARHDERLRRKQPTRNVSIPG
jgi:heptose I phosphotransferase